MSTPIRLQERDTSVTLRASHSQLEFPLWRAGFSLIRGDRTLLQTGPEWGDPASSLSLWRVDGDGAVLTYNRGPNGFGRLSVQMLDDGWLFAWDQPTRDTFDLASGGHWYGQGLLVHQRWPLEASSLPEAPLLTWDNGPTGLGNIQTPAWITATGVVILVEAPSDVLMVGFNASPEAALSDASQGEGLAPADMRPPAALPDASGLLSLADRLAPLRYRLLVGVDAPSAFRRLVQVVGKPSRTPPEGLLRSPIWTSWARYKADIDQAKIMDFAHEIRAHDYPGGTLEIDDKWQQAYGDSQFDPECFPDPAGMVRELNDMGFAVTLWVPTFLNPDSSNAQEAAREGYVVRRPDGEPYPVRWWQGTGYVLDLSHPEAVHWWAERLGALQKAFGLAGFKFDAGEANFLPADAVTHAPMRRNEYSTRWVEFAAQHFPYCEVRCGWFSQRQPVLFRQWDKFSVWGLDNGLASVITTALALSMTGYPFTLPDMIGGNAYGGVEPDKELFIRWVQASAPMMAIQFSLAPWDFDAETDDICRRYAKLHVDLADARVGAAQNAVETGEPVIRPIFWSFPRDAEAQVVDDEYLLGDEYLVAPVVKPRARTRDVYLPAGRWREYWSRREHLGGQWLHNFAAPLDTLPLFVRRA